MEKPENVNNHGPTASQAVEIRRTHAMKNFREGHLNADDVMAQFDMNLVTGSTRAFSVSGGKSKIDTPAKNALLTKHSTTDLYNARFLGDDTMSVVSGVGDMRRLDDRSIISMRVEGLLQDKMGEDLAKERQSNTVSRQPIRNFEMSRNEAFKALLQKKFDKRSQMEIRHEEDAIRERLSIYGFEDSKIRAEIAGNKGRVNPAERLRFAQAIRPAHKDPYAYGGVDGGTQEPLIGWEDGQPYINNFNNNATVTVQSARRAAGRS
eukprot:CAMPEP_0179428492 /NCGR_PEP_ID=MMETSP0799-20121207/14157_1 /TAXON_ID=46947 /ORGANISM="Geminigera cryophila, Strain CCMP2564" /LENGTH=263 /DNA_ID=CAMNT_0021204027 /DNA_START=109 /DNA_END=903 /DNA_ORIENTATION=+